MGDSDKVFMQRFSGIIAGLIIVTVLLIVIATFNEKPEELDENPSRLALATARIQPVGAVRTELPAPAPQPAAAVEVAAEASAPASPDIDGAGIYSQVCMACHMTGAAGAPVPGTDAWAERVAKGADVLVANAINGIGIMPAKGGRMDLSDEEVQAAVEHMLAQ